jgi:hypothetical protein
MTFRQGTTAVIIPSASIDLNRENRASRSRSRIARRLPCMAAAVAGIWSALALAQEMEPRTYSAVPVGTNFVVADYARSSGDITFDPSLPVTGLQATINNYSLGYSHSFGMLGHVASIAVSVPYANANVTGNVEGEPEHAYRSGMGDVRFRFAANLLGGPALTPEEFAQRSPDTILGASVSVIAPTGQYVPSRIINVGSNRWAFKPEIGLSQPLGDWFVEGTAGVWLFTDNPDFYGGTRRSQDPLPTFQWHGGYTWRPGLWLAADVTYYTGGQTSVNGLPDHDLQRNVRYGVTLSFPLSTQWSGKLAWSRGLVTSFGGNFQTISVALQYRWFNR